MPSLVISSATPSFHIEDVEGVDGLEVLLQRQIQKQIERVDPTFARDLRYRLILERRVVRPAGAHHENPVPATVEDPRPVRHPQYRSQPIAKPGDR